jgi:hypothetical protein
MILNTYNNNKTLKIKLNKNKKKTKTKTLKIKLNKNNKKTKTKKLKKHTNNEKRNKIEITTELSWNELKKYHRNPPDDFTPRNKNVRIKYAIHKKYIKKHFSDINTYIKHKYFSGKFKNYKYRLIRNQFPYLIENNIKHYNLWFNPKYYNNNFPNLNNKPKFIQTILKKINKYLKLNENVIYFENKHKNQSVNNIRHIQLFILD